MRFTYHSSHSKFSALYDMHWTIFFPSESDRLCTRDNHLTINHYEAAYVCAKDVYEKIERETLACMCERRRDVILE